MKDILYDITELLTKAYSDKSKKPIINFILIKLGVDIHNINDPFEVISENIIDILDNHYYTIYRIVKDIDVGYDTSEAKEYLLGATK